jgi:hypothetical protein
MVLLKYQPMSYKNRRLHISIPQVQIAGGPDIYVREGSSVTLECIVAEASSPVYIAWQFNRGDVPGSRVSVLGQYIRTFQSNAYRVQCKL